MIKVYGMPSCPDCSYVEEQIAGKEDEFEFIDIGAHVRNMKEFLHLRDTDPAFAGCAERGSVGIPAFLFEDGHVSLAPEDAGLKANPGDAACSIADHKAGKKGC